MKKYDFAFQRAVANIKNPLRLLMAEGHKIKIFYLQGEYPQLKQYSQPEIISSGAPQSGQINDLS